MTISVLGEKKAKASAVFVKRAARAALSFLSKKKANLSVVFVADREISRLNRVYRGKKGATDILSFETGDKIDLGDVFISPRSAKLKAEKRGMAYRDYLKLLIVHGTLHLLGFDHRTEKEGKAMEKMERKILKGL
jgi:probable rRNA maturation factor